MSYDVVIIGSGPGGYVCAIKAAQLGLKIAVVEKSKNFGGTCLNVGCIPSKALLHASEVYAEACRGFDALGITLSKPELKISEMMQHKQSMIAANTKGVNFLFKNNKIDSFLGSGKILESGKVEVLAKDGKKFLLETKNIVIATGAAAANIPGINIVIDENVVVSSTGALSFEKVPNTMVVIGAGVIGSELGLVWRRLGAKVIIIEFLDKVLSTMDVELSRKFQKFMENQGIIYKLGTKVTEIVKSGAGAIVSFEPVTGGKTEQVATDVVLIAVGRRPFIEGLGLQAAGVVLDKHGRISIDRRWHTNISGIYAIGDVVGGTMLAHKAEEEGIAVAEILAGQAGHVNFDVIPSVVYTQPEVASIGKTEEELKADGVTYKVGKCSFTANSRARAMRRTDGFVKILACAKTDRVLGGHIVGFGASEMIHELAVLMAFSGSSEDLGRLCHAHPTMSETIRESAFAIFSKPIHI
ncbi:MAG: dihydrolipoamide dehydrogenase [Candidatus Tokpelaia sp. JSC085]|nr:MAG: dihydrolipoamide dehydrogenase [Candidatus Tokpelaia sp. JSC085]